MIYQALNSVTRALNQHLVRKFSLRGQQAAVLGAVLSQAGTIPEHSLNKIVVTLINLEHETAVPFTPSYLKQGPKTNPWQRQENQPYNFNLDVLITAVFEDGNYDEGLKFLSEAIFFFQRKNVFTDQNTQHLDRGIQELAFELVKLSYHQEHSLWGALGAKYMPSVLFKVRLLSFQNSQVEEVPSILDFGPPPDQDSIVSIQ
jgi:hypothetical protein